MTSLVDDFEFPNTRDVVGIWKYNASINYGSMEDIHRTQVTALWWYKSAEGLEHEYVVAICHRDGEAHDIILRLERRTAGTDRALVVAENVLPKEATEKLSSELSKLLNADVKAERKILKKTLWAATQKTAAKKGKNPDSFDTVTRLSGSDSCFGEEERLLYYHNFRLEKPFYVRDLAFLADTINQHKRGYRPLINQCYWYARTLVNVAVGVYGPSITNGQECDAAGTYTVGKEAKGVRITVSEDCQDEVQAIRKKFEDAIEEHNVKVHSRYQERMERVQELEDKIEKVRCEGAQVEGRLFALAERGKQKD